MPSNGFSVGRDLTLSIIGPTGPLRFNLLTDFTCKKTGKTRTVTGLDGITRAVPNRAGEWTGSFSIERQDASVDSYFAQLEANYFAGLNEPPMSITETITEASGAVSQFRLLGVVLDYEDAGSWRGDDTVKLKISFMASRRVEIK